MLSITPLPVGGSRLALGSHQGPGVWAVRCLQATFISRSVKGRRIQSPRRQNSIALCPRAPLLSGGPSPASLGQGMRATANEDVGPSPHDSAIVPPIARAVPLCSVNGRLAWLLHRMDGWFDPLDDRF